jgi:hypothetical protein
MEAGWDVEPCTGVGSGICGRGSNGEGPYYGCASDVVGLLESELEECRIKGVSGYGAK